MHDQDKYPRVSIVLPTYDRADFIMQAIVSIQKQTYSNWELLVVDDGSTDNTESLVKQIADDRIIFLKTKSRLGIIGTRNEGLRNATGQLIAFIDSDDLWDAAKLEKQVKALSQYPDAGFSLTGGYNFTRNNEPAEYFYKQREGVKYGDVFLSFFRSEVAATIPTLVFKRECLKALIEFDETMPLADMDFIFRLARAYKAIILFEPLFFRRIHGNNYSSINWVKRQKQGLDMLQAYKASLPKEIARDCFYRTYINFGEQYLIHREPRKALSQFYYAWQKKPFGIVPFKKMGKAILHIAGIKNSSPG
jgi:glycosyltransferase involved in cell wall biosynthesis